MRLGAHLAMLLGASPGPEAFLQRAFDYLGAGAPLEAWVLSPHGGGGAPRFVYGTEAQLPPALAALVARFPQGARRSPESAGPQMQLWPLHAAGELRGLLCARWPEGAALDGPLGVAVPMLAGALPSPPAGAALREGLGPVAEALGEGILITDSHGLIVMGNPGAVGLLGGDVTKVNGRPLGALFEDLDLAREAIAEGSTPGGWRSEVRLRRGAGSFPAYLSGRPLSLGGQSPRILWLVHDLTAVNAHRRESEARARLESVANLAAGTAHELNNPLSGVIGFAELLKEEGLAEPAERYLDIILQQSKRCKELIRNLLIFGQIYPSEPSMVHLRSVVEGALDIGGYGWRRGHLTFDLALPSELPRVRVDVALMREALYNILHNAVLSMPDGGVIRIEGRVDPGPQGEPRVALSVIDQGIGISSQLLEPWSLRRRS